MGNRVQMDGLMGVLDQNRALGPWRATGLSSVYRYDRFFSSCFCLVLALLHLLGIPACDLSSLAPAWFDQTCCPPPLSLPSCQVCFIPLLPVTAGSNKEKKRNL